MPWVRKCRPWVRKSPPRVRNSDLLTPPVKCFLFHNHPGFIPVLCSRGPSGLKMGRKCENAPPWVRKCTPRGEEIIALGAEIFPLGAEKPALGAKVPPLGAEIPPPGSEILIC